MVLKGVKLIVLVLLISFSMLLIKVSMTNAITLDGVAVTGEWDAAWHVSTDPLDVYVTGIGTHPHEAPNYARSGYDGIALWGHYQGSDDRWYFRIDVDGRGGDSDSASGTAGNLGVGTHGFDDGPLCTPPFQDSTGIGPTEHYRLNFQYESGGLISTSVLGGDSSILPGVISPVTGDIAGTAAYGISVPGVIEWSFDPLQIFPAGSQHSQLWVSAQMGDSSDEVSDDSIPSALVIGQDIQTQCPSGSVMVGHSATFGVQYSVPSTADQGISNVAINVDIPAGTSFVSADNGGISAGGIITWSLGDMNPGDSGEVHFTLRVDTNMASVDIIAGMTCNEGLYCTSECASAVMQAIPALGNKGLTALLLLLAAAAVLFIRRRPA